MTRSTGAIAVALIAVALVSCATPPPPPPEVTGAGQSALAQRRAAQDIVASYISAQLNADPIYYFRHVNVRVDEDGVVTLSGYVWDTPAIYRARQIAGQVPGVTRVVTSQLELERNGRNTGPAR